MIPATPIRAKPRRMCTYKTPPNRLPISHSVSALARPPRICTFHSYFKLCVFNPVSPRRTYLFQFLHLQKERGTFITSGCAEILLSSSPVAIHQSQHVQPLWGECRCHVRRGGCLLACSPRMDRTFHSCSLVHASSSPIRLIAGLWPFRTFGTTNHFPQETLTPLASSKAVCSRTVWTYNRQLATDPRRVCL